MPRFGDQDPPKKKYQVKTRDGRAPRNNFPDGTLPPLDGVTGVYLIHFDKKLQHAEHYMGSAEDIAKRERRHRKGHGAQIMKAVVRAGIPWQIVHVWRCETIAEAEKLERQKKGYNKRQCPICTPWEEVAS